MNHPDGHHREGIKKMTREDGEGWGSHSGSHCVGDGGLLMTG